MPFVLNAGDRVPEAVEFPASAGSLKRITASVTGIF